MNPINQHVRLPISRREFVRTSALAAGAVALSGPFIRVARANEPGANSKLRVGLIGCGGMGTGDLATFFRNPEVDCAVLCDVDDSHFARSLELCASQSRPGNPDAFGEGIPQIPLTA
jgi:hypothetical protein